MKKKHAADGVRQVYGVAGGGKLAFHLARYLSLLQLPCRLWTGTKTGVSPRAALSGCGVVVVAISDSSIIPFIKKHLLHSGAALVHCSGALHTPLAYGAHPLAVFGTQPYPLEVYSAIPFVTEKGGPSFPELFPGLPNPHFAIEPSQKPLYHALCCAGANFSSMLWAEYFDRLERGFGIPREAASSLLRTAALNSAASGGLTGPLARGDAKTVAAHLRALKGERLENLYRAFVDFYADSGSGVGRKGAL